MKRKLLLIALAFSLVFSLSMAAGCKTVQPHKPCTHEYDDWIIDTDATCTEAGSKHRVCTICKNEESETIEAKGHTYGDWIIDSDATCTEAGSKHRVCTVCENNETETIAIKGHIYGEWITDTEATCTTAGTKHQNCKNCDSVIDGTIDATGVHTPGDDYVCTGCGAVVCPSEYLKTILTASSSVTLDKDYILTDDWTPVAISAGATINGNGHYISGLTSSLVQTNNLSLTFDGLTIKDSVIAPTDLTKTGCGAFIGAATAINQTYKFTDCHLENVTIEAYPVAADTTGSQAGGFMGNVPSAEITIDGCSVKNCVINGNSSTAGFVGLVGKKATIKNSSVQNSEFSSVDDGGWRVGAIVGTIGGSGAATIENCSESDNAFEMPNSSAQNPNHGLYGRIYAGGTLEVDGAVYVCVSTLNQFTAAVNNSEIDVIVLAADMTSPVVTGFRYTLERDLTVDFGGHSLTTAPDLFEVKDGATLTLISSVQGGKLYCNSNQGGPVTLIKVDNGGVLNIEDGVEIDCSMQFELYYPMYTIHNYGTVNMNGGKITQRNGVVVMGQGDFVFNMNGGEIVLMSDLRDADDWNLDYATGISGDYNSNATINFNGGKVSGDGELYETYSNEVVTIDNDFINEVKDVNAE